MTHAKGIRVTDRELLDLVKSLPCTACGTFGTEFNPIDPDHISTRGSGAGDVEHNIWALCREHHAEKGKGFGKFLAKYPSCVEWLKINGRQDVFERLGRI